MAQETAPKLTPKTTPKAAPKKAPKALPTATPEPAPVSVSSEVEVAPLATPPLTAPMAAVRLSRLAALVIGITAVDGTVTPSMTKLLSATGGAVEFSGAWVFVMLPKPDITTALFDVAERQGNPRAHNAHHPSTTWARAARDAAAHIAAVLNGTTTITLPSLRSSTARSRSTRAARVKPSTVPTIAF